ncbi:trypsin-like peptidase domain-containing protein [Paenibacillus sp. IB182496]|uniref:Trypsin-like peptidase domain-containing protein n=1 Tax=Paenibacillus sabuli TaxID=2772509 RepID=A0A927GTJ1_9BACL|nr:serine protease [Paenibacillus sabuli]MBD2847396.1 trypsin-like peptidase domain-containing protein [Paenibacillus sabuli]
MRQRIGIVLGAIVLLAAGLMLAMQPTGAEEPQQYEAREIYSEAAPAVFYLRNLTADGALRSVGSGVLIEADGTAVTAYHVVKSAERLEAIMADGSLVTGITVTAYDALTDAAVLQFPSRPAGAAPYPSVSLRTADAVHGEPVFAIGYPLKETPVITEGIVNAPAAVINGRERVLVSAQIASGMSGGPVLDARGRLAGVVSGSLRTIDGIHLVVGAKQLQAAMSDPG